MCSGWPIHDDQRALRKETVHSLVGSRIQGLDNGMKYVNARRGLVAMVFCLTVPWCASAQSAARVVHVFVALADNQHQGIVPVPAKLGDGDAPASNLYWGAAFGVKSYFRASSDWQMLSCAAGPKQSILERCVFRHRDDAVYLLADAYRGSQIREAVSDFLGAASGRNPQRWLIGNYGHDVELPINGGADLVAYVGHDAFMDFQIEPVLGSRSAKPRLAIILACASKQYFAPYLERTGADPLLWTTGLMAPEAYTLKSALDGWMKNESGGKIRNRAAEAYDKYQHCGLRAAQRLFSTGW